MKPARLARACGQCIAERLMMSVRHLIITETVDKDELVATLSNFLEVYRDVVWSNVMVQDQIYRSLIACLRGHCNPSVNFAVMIVMCPKVTIDQIAVIEDQNGLPPVVSGTGLDMTSDECDAVLDVISRLKKGQTFSSHTSREEFSLPTTSLVLEGIYFHDPDFLPRLFREMPHLRHIEIQYNGTPTALRALSRYCPCMESLSFLEPRMEVPVLEKDILPILFGVPATEIQRNRSLISRYAEDEHFRSLFKIQFPNLKQLNLDELYFEEELLHDVYTIVLILHPNMMCFGKHTGLTRNLISKYRRVWTVTNRKSFTDVEILLTKAKFVDSVFDAPNDSELELRYIESIVPMFKSLKSLELQKHFWSEREIGEFCRMFAHQVEAISLNELLISHISCLSSVRHLRLTFTKQYSFDEVHFILDHCLQLETLSIHSLFHEHSQNFGNVGQPLQNIGRLIDDDQQFIENLLVGELVDQMEGMQAFMEEAHENQENPVANNHPVAGAVRPIEPVLISRKHQKHKTHLKLKTLRIASLFEAAKDPSEIFLLSLLVRLPNLRFLCLGMWMGALSQRRENLTCAGKALVNVIASTLKDAPLLQDLQQVCCLPSGTESEMCSSLVFLAESLPSLHTIVVPALDSFLLSPTLQYFKHSSIEIRHKCATDQVFSHYEPEH